MPRVVEGEGAGVLGREALVGVPGGGAEALEAAVLGEADTGGHVVGRVHLVGVGEVVLGRSGYGGGGGVAAAGALLHLLGGGAAGGAGAGVVGAAHLTLLQLLLLLLIILLRDKVFPAPRPRAASAKDNAGCGAVHGHGRGDAT